MVVGSAGHVMCGNARQAGRQDQCHCFGRISWHSECKCAVGYVRTSRTRRSRLECYRSSIEYGMVKEYQDLYQHGMEKN